MHTSLEVRRKHVARVAKVRATRFPPPLRGRDRERGGDKAPSAKLVLCKRPRDRQLARICWATIQNKGSACCTPLPVPPPQGGREPCGTALPNRRPAFA